MNLKRFWPWKEIDRLKTEVARFQKEVEFLRHLHKSTREENRDLRSLESTLLQQLSELKKELSDTQEKVQMKEQHLRKMGVILAMKGGIAVLFMACLNLYAQPVVRTFTTTNYSGFDPSQFATNNGKITVTNVQGIFTMATDTAANLDAAVPPLAMPEWALDQNRMTVGDGATSGGLAVGVRLVPDFNHFQNARTGEVAVSTITATTPTLMISAGNGTTNFVPVISVQQNGASPQGTNLVSLGGAPFQVNVGSFGSGSDVATFGLPGFIGQGAFSITGGSGGASSGGGQGGNGGGTSASTYTGGLGGNGTGASSIGGNGGNAGSFSLGGGNGGSATHGFTAGNGGVGGVFQSPGGNGGADTASANGGTGGSGGFIQLNGANATSTGLNGGTGGNVVSKANGTNTAGSLTMSATATRKGGNSTTFGSSYAPMTIFTTTTTAGPNNTASATSLIGTVADLAPPSGQNFGAVIASNVVDHAGRTMRFRLEGYIATNGGPTLEIVIALGGTTIIDTGAQVISSITSTQTWVFSGQVTFRTTGASGTCIGQGTLQYGTTATATSFIQAPQTATTTIDTTKDESITCTAQFSTGTGCTMQCTDQVWELVN